MPEIPLSSATPSVAHSPPSGLDRSHRRRFCPRSVRRTLGSGSRGISDVRAAVLRARLDPDWMRRPQSLKMYIERRLRKGWRTQFAIASQGLGGLIGVPFALRAGANVGYVLTC